MAGKIRIPLYGDDGAPRFDVAAEVLIAVGDGPRSTRSERIMVLSQPSSGKLCQFISGEGIDTVVCNGIEEAHYQYLTWKRVEVPDSVIGRWKTVLKRYPQGDLKPGEILRSDTNP